ncbi:MAG TPA: DMT family transporter [Flavipsychrobacter sp.]|nr:DMT family transporter [Flavipsychrobacter sp.]
MTYLLLTVLLNVFIFSLFKLFPRYGIDNLPAIVVNYITCVVTGSLFIGKVPYSSVHLHQPWFYWALLMGGMFIGIFNFIAFTVRKTGLTATTIANKLSLVIPVIFSVFLYHEKLSGLKIIGIFAAFPAVYLATRTGEKENKQSWTLPLLLFLCSGLLDTLVKFTENRYLNTPTLQSVYLIYVFTTAAISGLVMIAVMAFQKNIRWKKRNILAGILLGIPNYFSMYYFVRLLHSNFLQSSAAIPINNMGIVLLSTLIAILFFKEKPTKARVCGLILSVLSILLIYFADTHDS